MRYWTGRVACGVRHGEAGKVGWYRTLWLAFRVACIICFCFGLAFVFLLVFVHAFSLAYHGALHGTLIEGYLGQVPDEVSSCRVLLRPRPAAALRLYGEESM